MSNRWSVQLHAVPRHIDRTGGKKMKMESAYLEREWLCFVGDGVALISHLHMGLQLWILKLGSAWVLHSFGVHLNLCPFRSGAVSLRIRWVACGLRREHHVVAETTVTVQISEL